MKKLLLIFLCTAIIFSVSVFTLAEDEISVVYDGNEIVFDVSPEMINDRVMVPMRQIFETFGAKVKWDSSTQTVTAKKKSKTIEMTINSTDMKKNDEVFSYDTAPVIKDGRTLIPIRALSELLGLEVEWQENTQSVIITTPEDDDDSWKENIQSVDLSELTVTGDGNSVDGNIITIADAGDYTVTGICDDGQIVVDSEGKVKLRLDGINLTNTTGSAIYIKNADKAYITLESNTENYLSDGSEYTNGDEKQKGCITARDTLEIKGSGSLVIDGNYNNGIHAADSLSIENGVISINAANDGIHVNDTFQMTGGDVIIETIGDGIQSEEIVDIVGGSVNITTSGVIASSNNNNDFMGRQPFFAQAEETQEPIAADINTENESVSEEENSDASSKGIKADWLLDISGGVITVNSTDHSIHSASDINIKGGEITISSDNKGMSAHGDIVIDDGDINIIKSTEGIETKQILTINGGNFNIISSDDGLNAGGGSLGMEGGMGNRPDNGERTGENGGMEMKGRQRIEGNISGEEFNPKENESFGGEMNMPPDNPDMSSMNDIPDIPDMSNIPDMPDMMPDMPDMSNMNDMRGGFGGMMISNSTEISAEHHIQINGGEFYICADNDGIDSNGSLVIEGGKIVIEGRSTAGGGDMGLDTDMGLIINGGEILAAGTAIGENSAVQNTVMIYLPVSAETGSRVEIRNSGGETLISHEVKKSFAEFLYSSDKLKTGEEYFVYADGEQKESFTVTDKLITVGTVQNIDRGGMDRNFEQMR